MIAVAEGDVLTRAELQTTCELLARACTAAGVVDAEELDARRPAATDDVHAWLSYHGWLRVRHGDVDPRRAEAGAAEENAAAAFTAALAAEPVPVALQLDSLEAPLPVYPAGLRVAVHPKSPYVLRWLDSLDAQMRGAALAAERCLALDVPSDYHVLALVPLAHAEAVRMWAWILTTPGPDLPFDPDDQATVTPPPWTRALSAADLLALYQAHQQIHQVRQLVIGQAYGARERGGPQSGIPLEGFLATFAAEHGAARPADTVRRWSLGEMTALAIGKADLERARAHAKAQAGAAR